MIILLKQYSTIRTKMKGLISFTFSEVLAKTCGLFEILSNIIIILFIYYFHLSSSYIKRVMFYEISKHQELNSKDK